MSVFAESGEGRAVAPRRVAVPGDIRQGVGARFGALGAPLSVAELWRHIEFGPAADMAPY